jgi:hypothetical protein
MTEKEKELQHILETKQFSDEDVDTLIRLIKFYEKYESQLKELAQREAISELWASARLKVGKIVKWTLGSFLTLVAVLQGWQLVISIFFRGTNGE